MPKRSYDTAIAMPANDKAPPIKVQKTERSHEENQERAYIAASRRADRSLEARVQSAKMASEIHRRRTGRGLKVSEEIVLKEEMYEEEEDDLPRHYKYLTAHLKTNSSELNHRVNAYITTQTAMATMARYNEINRLFSESFPTAASYQQQINNSMYMGPLMNTGPFSPTLPGSNAGSTQASPTTPVQSHFGGIDRRSSAVTSSGSPGPNTPLLSPGTTAKDTESTKSSRQAAFTDAQLDSRLAQQSAAAAAAAAASSFTSELPNEVKQMANIDMNDPMAMSFFGGNPLHMFGGQYGGHSTTIDLKHHDSAEPTSPTLEDGSDETALFSPIDDSMNFYDSLPADHFNHFGTPSGGGGGGTDAWESFVDFGTEQ
ncbi:hypothetical protein F5Y15DRAFT_72040 [Xylariaceae sp. FL0016]|nr:hypothetical protein F5Y15DRAFT_72040 [Xylariaceae sp. FL0016]